MDSNFNKLMAKWIFVCIMPIFSQKKIVITCVKIAPKKILDNTNVRSHQGLLNYTNLNKFGQFKTLFWYFGVSI